MDLISQAKGTYFSPSAHRDARLDMVRVLVHWEECGCLGAGEKGSKTDSIRIQPPEIPYNNELITSATAEMSLPKMKYA